ncbi:hypothetical protein F3157_11445 [Virgibacillus dakarensis]|uniref:Uncharacterized protein n=1 Tax=Lentibacillus populi TaxID=1827502 RepID=A0A9W5X6D6_9BACI|nr:MULTISPECIES: hypothetical protein [Bacillaceae]MBT2217433.1 hypothetical protein [Virgibacillus dakarensis]MTW86267.1 hypothetical protein [Virgibacillus dakarensis]GGB50266.1 hypothetical protein GCM10011409_29840 [Lentibacillus populi]
MYFKNDFHRELATKLMNKFGFKTLEDDRECGSFCYVSAATYKEGLLSRVGSEGGIQTEVY